MAKQIVATFGSRDEADSVKNAFMKDGFAAEDLIVMVNRESADPPEDARLEAGKTGEAGLAGLEEKIGKTVLHWMGKDKTIQGDGFEGEGKGGALLGVRLRQDGEEARVRALLQRYFASDIEVAQED